MRELKLGGEFETEPYQMKSGIAEAEKNTYDLYLGRSGKIWLVGNCLDKGGAIYCSAKKGSQGFGGRLMEFELTGDKGSISLHGPWHANSFSMFADTGVDFREHHLTYGAIGKDRKSKPGPGYVSILTDLVYFDKEPTLGAYARIENLAKKLSDEYGCALAYYFSSQGGSSCGFVNWEKYNRPQAEAKR